MSPSQLFLHIKVISFWDQSTTAHLFKRQHPYLLHLFPLALTALRKTLRRGFTFSFIYVDYLLLTFKSLYVRWSTAAPTSEYLWNKGELGRAQTWAT